MAAVRTFAAVNLIRIYECLCDATRLRIVHLLTRGPLCVSHFQEVLGMPQVKVSQHLAYLRKRGMVESTRHANWMIYSLPGNPSPALETSLECLRDSARTDRRFHADLKRLEGMRAAIRWVSGALKDR